MQFPQAQKQKNIHMQQMSTTPRSVKFEPLPQLIDKPAIPW